MARYRLCVVVRGDEIRGDSGPEGGAFECTGGLAVFKTSWYRWKRPRDAQKYFLSRWDEYCALWNSRLDAGKGDSVLRFDVHNWGGTRKGEKQSEIVRVGALAAAILSIWNVNFMKQALMTIMVYCFVMFPFNLNAASSYSVVLKITSLNLLWFKKDSTVAVDHAIWGSLLYILFLLFLYCFVFKHMDKHLLPRRESL